MIKSMTGYGKHQELVSGYAITVELRSVNHRHLDCSLKLPRECLYLESALKSNIQSVLHRGKVEVFVSVDSEEPHQDKVQVNHRLAKSYHDTLCLMASHYHLPLGVTAMELAGFPDVISLEKESPLDKEWLAEQTLHVLNEALSQMILMRQQEGSVLGNDLLSKTNDIEELLHKMEKKVPQVSEAYQKRLTEKITKMLEHTLVDEQKILTEVAIFADKVAIDEEIVRLHSHIALLRTLLTESEPVGRKLDFLIQECSREINTIGSKSNDLEFSHWVVDLKSILEKIREQAQNIE